MMTSIRREMWIYAAIAAAALMVWMAAHNYIWQTPRPVLNAVVAVHTINADLCTAPHIARHYGWGGDWREYRWQVQRLNGWERWPIVHVAQQILVPDYRRCPGRAGDDEVTSLPRLLDRGRPAPSPGGHVRAASTH